MNIATSSPFIQLARAKSLSEIDDGLRSCEGKLKYLGMTRAPGRSTLSHATAHRSPPFSITTGTCPAMR